MRTENDISEPSSSELTLGEAEVVAIFVQMTQVLGFQKSLGEIYGLLFATPRPLSFQEIVDRLKLSKGSVSQGLRFLRTIGAVRAVVIPGDRREFFEPETELRALVGGILRERINPQLEAWGARARGLKLEDFQSAGAGAENGSTSKEEQEVLSARLEKLKTWQKRAHAVLPMVSKLIG